MYVITEALWNAQTLNGCQNPAFEWSLLNMHVTFDSQYFEAGRLAKWGMEQVSEVTE